MLTASRAPAGSLSLSTRQGQHAGGRGGRSAGQPTPVVRRARSGSGRDLGRGALEVESGGPASSTSSSVHVLGSGMGERHARPAAVKGVGRGQHEQAARNVHRASSPTNADRESRCSSVSMVTTASKAPALKRQSGAVGGHHRPATGGASSAGRSTSAPTTRPPRPPASAALPGPQQCRGTRPPHGEGPGRGGGVRATCHPHHCAVWAEGPLPAGGTSRRTPDF